MLTCRALCRSARHARLISLASAPACIASLSPGLARAVGEFNRSSRAMSSAQAVGSVWPDREDAVVKLDEQSATQTEAATSDMVSAVGPARIAQSGSELAAESSPSGACATARLEEEGHDTLSSQSSTRSVDSAEAFRDAYEYVDMHVADRLTPVHSPESPRRAEDTCRQLDGSHRGAPEAASRPGWFTRPAATSDTAAAATATDGSASTAPVAKLDPMANTVQPYTMNVPPPLAPRACPSGWFSSSDYPCAATGAAPAVVYVTNERQLEPVIKMLRGPVVGFDLEWVTRRPGYNGVGTRHAAKNVSLVQIADDRTILLIQISRFATSASTGGRRTLPACLRRLVEDPAIIKCGVSIMGSDMSRLRDLFGVTARGVCELSYFARLVDRPRLGPANTLVALSRLSQLYLGRPLRKGPVRTSDWEAVPLSAEQREYAADDAYAGYLIFQELERIRQSKSDFQSIWPRIGQCPPRAGSIVAAGRAARDGAAPTTGATGSAAHGGRTALGPASASALNSRPLASSASAATAAVHGRREYTSKAQHSCTASVCNSSCSSISVFSTSVSAVDSRQQSAATALQPSRLVVGEPVTIDLTDVDDFLPLPARRPFAAFERQSATSFTATTIDSGVRHRPASAGDACSALHTSAAPLRGHEVAASEPASEPAGIPRRDNLSTRTARSGATLELAEIVRMLKHGVARAPSSDIVNGSDSGRRDGDSTGGVVGSGSNGIGLKTTRSVRQAPKRMAASTGFDGRPRPRRF